MTEQLNQFVNQRLPLPGLLAWGTQLPDGQIASHGYNDRFRGSQISEFLRSIGTMTHALSQGQSEPPRFCWKFQLARVYVATARDGTNLALFFRNEEKLMAEAIASLLSDFEQLPLDTPA